MVFVVKGHPINSFEDAHKPRARLSVDEDGLGVTELVYVDCFMPGKVSG